jgi:hypothetical protein
MYRQHNFITVTFNMTTLQTGRPGVRFPMRLFLNLPNSSGRTRALRFTQPLTEMSTGTIKIIKFLGSKVRRVRRDDNLTVICEPIV